MYTSILSKICWPRNKLKLPRPKETDLDLNLIKILYQKSWYNYWKLYKYMLIGNKESFFQYYVVPVITRVGALSKTEYLVVFGFDHASTIMITSCYSKNDFFYPSFIMTHFTYCRFAWFRYRYSWHQCFSRHLTSDTIWIFILLMRVVKWIVDKWNDTIK